MEYTDHALYLQIVEESNRPCPAFQVKTEYTIPVRGPSPLAQAVLDNHRKRYSTKRKRKRKNANGHENKTAHK